MATAQTQTIYVMEGANMICGTVKGAGSSAGISTHLVLQELKLPTIEENFVDHNAGGAPVGIEIPTHINKLEGTFNLAGWDPSVMKFVAQNDPRFSIFTAYGLIRDRRTGLATQARATMWGRMGRANPTAFSRGNLMAHEYSIKSIVHYELTMQTDAKNKTDSRIYYWDFFESSLTIGDVNLTSDYFATLAIPTVNVGNAPSRRTRAA